MKCPQCGAWNQAFLTKCRQCGADLPEAGSQQASWEEALHEKKPTLRVEVYEEDDLLEEVDQGPAIFDPEKYDRAELTDEIEELARRRSSGASRLETLRKQAEEMKRSLREAEIIHPIEEDPERTRRTPQQERIEPSGVFYSSLKTAQRRNPEGPRYVFTDETDEVPVFHDGYSPDDPEDMNRPIMPRRMSDGMSSHSPLAQQRQAQTRRKNTWKRLWFALMLLGLTSLFAIGGVMAARFYVSSQGQQVRKDNEAYAEVFPAQTEDGHAAHTIVVHGKENATVYLQQTASSYVIADGIVSVTIPDYMWYDTDSSTYAAEVEGDTLDVTVSPFIRYTQEGEQFAIAPVHFTIDVPLSPVYLLNPPTMHAEVGVSIFEVRLNVLAGSTVIIDGANVSTLIRETGNVSKNVQVLPVGDNIISISVKSKFCRENKMEVVLYRAPQEIPLELSPTVMSEWNYEADDEQHQAAINGTTLPGAMITVESPHENLTIDHETGSFSFKPLFPKLGNNEITIRASYENRADSVITHTVYYMPTADVYTRRAWDLDAQYGDLINYIGMRKGTIYVGTGVIKRIISSTPQMAILDIGTENFEKLVLLENSSKTTWVVGVKYRIYGEAYGLYDTMPRLTVRYTYLMD